MIKKSYLVCFIYLPLIGMHGGDASLLRIAMKGAATEAQKNLSDAQKSLAELTQRGLANVSENKNTYTLAAGAVGAAALLGRLAWRLKSRPAAKPISDLLDTNAAAVGGEQPDKNLGLEGILKEREMSGVKSVGAGGNGHGGDESPQGPAADAPYKKPAAQAGGGKSRIPTPHTSPVHTPTPVENLGSVGHAATRANALSSMDSSQADGANSQSFLSVPDSGNITDLQAAGGAGGVSKTPDAEDVFSTPRNSRGQSPVTQEDQDDNSPVEDGRQSPIKRFTNVPASGLRSPIATRSPREESSRDASPVESQNLHRPESTVTVPPVSLASSGGLDTQERGTLLQGGFAHLAALDTSLMQTVDLTTPAANAPTLQEAQAAVDREVAAIKDLSSGAAGAAAGGGERRPSVDDRHRFVSEGKHYVETYKGSNKFVEEKQPNPDGGTRPVRMGSARNIGSGGPGCYR